MSSDGAKERSFAAMGTTVHLVARGGPTDVLRRAEASIRDLEAKWSRFREDSELSILNANRGHVTIVSAETFDVIDAAIQAWAETNGDFDPTVLDALTASGYDRSFDQLRATPPPHDVGPVPTPAAITLERAACAVTLPPGIGLDLGGIAKGAAADLVAHQILADGADGACVNVGGDVRVVGEGPVDGAWCIGLGPAISRSPEAFTLTMSSGAVCTSSTSRRSWQVANEHRHHLIDPRTGRCTETDVESVSIIAANATTAEVLTKVIIARGLVEGATALSETAATGVARSIDGRLVRFAGIERFVPAEAA